MYTNAINELALAMGWALNNIAFVPGFFDDVDINL